LAYSDAEGDVAVNVDLNGCCKGRKVAWDAFVKQTAPLVYAAVKRTLRAWNHTQQDIEDRVQDVYVKLLADECRLLKTYDDKRASLSTWLTLVARSTTRDALQKRRIETVPIANQDGSAPSFIPATPSAQSNANGILLPQFDCLTERQREVLAMLFEQNMTVEEAAARLEVDPQTVRSTKHKALTRLRQQMGLDPISDTTPQKPADREG
jgi:RNA polymerase sigma factor (sigma-70 family)